MAILEETEGIINCVPVASIRLTATSRRLRKAQWLSEVGNRVATLLKRIDECRCHGFSNNKLMNELEEIIRCKFREGLRAQTREKIINHVTKNGIDLSKDPLSLWMDTKVRPSNVICS